MAIMKPLHCFHASNNAVIIKVTSWDISADYFELNIRHH
ncbi:hypothetical protein PSPO_b1231 [Pseudoalteromonas spongiae UST010723-006]|nr:hypothetical protein PSPO_b1231 [Pseudoalteromonas spongiae UST010723-006]